jgi:hypothetical protein
MQGTFISPQGVQLSYIENETGKTIQAKGVNDFFVVMTIQEDAPSPITIRGSGLTAKATIGKQTISFDGSKIVFLN